MGKMNDMNDNSYLRDNKCSLCARVHRFLALHCVADGRVHVGWHDDRSAVMKIIISVDGVAFCDVLLRVKNNQLGCSG